MLTKNRLQNAARLALCALALTALANGAYAQKLIAGPRIGVASTGIEPKDLVIRNAQDVDALRLQIQNSSPEIMVGAFTRLTLLGIFVQPEVLLTTSSAEFLYEDLVSGGEEFLRERYWNLDVPIMAGIKFGPFRVQGGPVYRLNMSNKTDLTTIDGLTRNFKQSDVALQAGLGLDLGKKLILDLKYQPNLSDYRNEVTMFGNTHKVSDRQGQLSLSLGVAL
jgi:hypothetical protein